ncbi:MAG: Fe-S protein assembly chaperone HscA [Chitinophagaceae bacterium]|nr:Fe-S protein assembly chaperone HscA [Chitinophagaceae bacterium]
MAKIAINIATGSLQQEEIIVGIDLGTTNSLVAIIHPESKRPVALKEHDKRPLVPSVIHFGDNGQITVGEEAKQYLVTDPANTIFSAKRLMGKTYHDVKSNAGALAYKIIDGAAATANENKLVKVQVGETFYSAVDLSSLILKELKKQAEHILKTPVTKAVITVPAYFNDAQRQATRDAGKLAGLDVLRIINEPTAASLAYGFGAPSNSPKGGGQATTAKTIAVYDLGGGTFDISILNISDGIFEVLSTHGDTYLGGDDLDAAVTEYWIGEYKFAGDELKHRQVLRLKAEEAKKYLTANELFESVYEGVPVSLTREKFNELIKPIVEKTIGSCRNALKDAGLKTAEVDEIVMVGGSTRVPLVKKMVSEFFGKNLNDTVDPDEVVALGAAIQADILAGNTTNLLLLDVTPLSLGLETMGGLMDVLLPRNSKIPTRASRQYTTYKDGQGSMKIAVYQGERDMVKDNRRLAEFNLTGIPGMPAGMPKVEISFLINADGILVVNAKELRSGIEQSIEVKPQYGLTDEEGEKMLLDSMEHAKEDIGRRALTEAKTEAEQLLQTTEKFLQKNFTLVTPDEVSATSLAMQALQLSLELNDKNLIQTKTEELNDISRPYAERVMDQAVSKAMAGKKI